MFAEGGGRLPFDVGLLRALPYKLGDDGCPACVKASRASLADRLHAARNAETDSPLFQLLEGYPDIDHTKTDIFRDRVDYELSQKQRLAAARREGVNAVQAVEAELGRLEDVETGVIVDLFLSYRAVRAWSEMIRLAGSMPRPLAETAMVREQLALAHNRSGNGEEAERILVALLEERGASSETYGILGRVYKDRWQDADLKGDAFLAGGLLDRAIEAYLRGFESDLRDAYPGINAATLMEVKDPPDPRRNDVVPVVRYAVARRIAAGKPDYWDYATQLELAVLAKDREAAEAALARALAAIRESWEPETTARNLHMIQDARRKRGEALDWAEEVARSLEQHISR